ncbi:MAG: YdcF family protein [Cyclobacteriaceae bacterium]
MFFVLSKTIGLLTRPLVIVALLLLLSVLLKSKYWRKKIRITGFVLLFIFSNEFISNLAMMAWEPEPVPFAAVDHTYDVGILLCGVAASAKNTPDRIHFLGSSDRLIHTFQLFHQGKIRRILISGGDGRLLSTGQNEARDLRDILVTMGVPDSLILVEGISRNTHESALAVADMMPPGVEGKDCLLITSAFHMKRSVGCFRKAGIEAVPFPTDFKSIPVSFQPGYLLIPSEEALFNWRLLLKEWTGIAAYMAAGYI